MTMPTIAEVQDWGERSVLPPETRVPVIPSGRDHGCPSSNVFLATWELSARRRNGPCRSIGGHGKEGGCTIALVANLGTGPDTEMQTRMRHMLRPALTECEHTVQINTVSHPTRHILKLGHRQNASTFEAKGSPLRLFITSRADL